MHVVIDGLAARVGGGVTGLQGMLQGLTQAGPQHQYSVVLSPAYQSALIESKPDSVALIPVHFAGGDLPRRIWFQNVILPRILEQMYADVLYVSGEGAYSRFTVPAALLSGNLTLFARPHELTGSRLKLAAYRGLRRPFVLRSMRLSARVIFVSRVMRNIALQVTGLSPQKAAVIHHGVSSAFHPRFVERTESKSDYRQSYLLSVSSINVHKGYETLLRAYARLSGSTPTLVIAGSVLDKPTYLRMQVIIQEQHLEDRVKLLGAIEHSLLPNIYRDATAFVFPSHLESFGMPLLEAMACGLPIIASDLPVSREICGESVLYFHPGDVDDLAQQMQALLDNVQLQQELAGHALRRAQEFTWPVAAAKLLVELETIFREH